MRICVLGNQSRTVFIFWRVLIQTLIRQGHSVYGLVPDNDSESEAELHALGADVRHYTLDRKGLNPLHDLATYRSLRAVFSAEKTDLLFATTIKAVIYGCLAAKHVRIPHIYATITGLGYAFEADSLFKRGIHKLGVLLYRAALKGIEGVFFQNQDDAATFRQDGILYDDARVLFARGTGVDTQHFAPTPLPDPEQGPVFLTVGRLLEAKGFLEFVEAARLVRQKFPAARFRILGPKEQGLGSISEEAIAGWQKEGLVEYLGATSDVRPYVAASHVVVLASWREGTPTSIMEAMSMGRACIVTNVPGCREVVVPGENGLIVPAKNPAELARAMEELAENPERIRAMGQAGRKLAEEKFDAQVVSRGIVRDMRL